MPSVLADQFARLPSAYLRWSQRCVLRYNRPVVLKTDAYNEQWDHLPLPGGIAGNLKGAKAVHIVELNPLCAELARARNPLLTIRIGDIRRLPFDVDVFDVVLDLSTLDHVPPSDTSRVLNEYCRVMRPGGTLLLYVWCSERSDDSVGSDACEADGQRQFFFDYEALRGALESLFEIEHSEPALVDGDCVLYRFVASRTCSDDAT